MFRLVTTLALISVVLGGAVQEGYEYPKPSTPVILLKESVKGMNRQTSGFGFNLGGVVGSFGQNEHGSQGGHSHGSQGGHSHGGSNNNLFSPGFPQTGHNHYNTYNNYPDYNGHYHGHDHGHYHNNHYNPHYDSHHDCCHYTQHHHHHDDHHHHH